MLWTEIKNNGSLLWPCIICVLPISHKRPPFLQGWGVCPHIALLSTLLISYVTLAKIVLDLQYLPLKQQGNDWYWREMWYWSVTKHNTALQQMTLHLPADCTCSHEAEATFPSTGSLVHPSARRIGCRVCKAVAHSFTPAVRGKFAWFNKVQKKWWTQQRNRTACRPV